MRLFSAYMPRHESHFCCWLLELLYFQAGADYQALNLTFAANVMKTGFFPQLVFESLRVAYSTRVLMSLNTLQGRLVRY